MMIERDKIFNIQSNQEFNDLALQTFRFQAEYNLVYKSFIEFLNIHPTSVETIEQIPFLPIQFFKSHRILTQDIRYKTHKKFKNQKTVTNNEQPTTSKQQQATTSNQQQATNNKQQQATIFTSSGTTSNTQSKHYVQDLALYYKSLMVSFQQFYGNFKDYCILALLPSYLERKGSSLIEMVNFWMNQSHHSSNGFFLYNYQDLYEQLMKNEEQNQPTILIGVTFALLDFAELFSLKLPNTIIIETGGMKGRKKEMIRTELHQILQKKLKPKRIDSEYGMTELLSQCYAQGNEWFKAPNWMRVLIRDAEDTLSYVSNGKTGGVNIIDLANLYSCSFIATDDLGILREDDTFKILGRFDHSDVRGCSLLLNEN